MLDGGRDAEIAAVYDAGRGRLTLARGVAVFRVASFVWMVAFNVASQRFTRPVLAYGALAAAGVWVGWTSTAPERLVRRGVAFADLAISVGLVLIAGLVVARGDVVSPSRLFFASAYPVATPLVWGIVYGVRGGLAAATALGAALMLSRVVNGVPYSAAQYLSALNGAVYYFMAGGTMGVIETALRRQEDEVRRSVDGIRQASSVITEQLDRTTRAAERDDRRLAEIRSRTHDPVLQWLGGIERRARERSDGRGPSAEVAQDMSWIADEAVRVERALRDLIDPDDPDAPEGLTTLRPALRDVSREVAVSVETVCPRGLALPVRTVHLLRDAVRQALSNVEEHAHAQGAWVFVEREPDALTVSIRDNGLGFTYSEDALERSDAIGLRAIRDAAAELGGRMRIIAAVGLGTEVELRVPLPADRGREGS